MSDLSLWLEEEGLDPMEFPTLPEDYQEYFINKFKESEDASRK